MEKPMAVPESPFYKSLLDNLNEAVYYVDRDRKITYWNKAAEAISGYEASEVDGTLCWNGILQHIRDELTQIAERARLLIERSSVPMYPHTVAVTVSIGATLGEQDDTVDALVRRADRLMYQSKAGGRNRVTVSALQKGPSLP